MPQHLLLSASTEDYLEAIVSLCGERGSARARDIAASVGVTVSSVTVALRKLGRMGLVRYTPYEAVTLTPSGTRIARKIEKRHKLLHKFFREALGVSEQTADADACRLEHGLSRETVERLTAFMEFLEECPRAGSEWLGRFREQCRQKVKPRTCLKCVERWLPEIRKKLRRKRAGGASRRR